MQTLFVLTSFCFAAMICLLLEEEKEISLYRPITREEYKRMSLLLLAQHHHQLSKTDYRKHNRYRMSVQHSL